MRRHSYSGMAEYLSCPRKYYYSHILNYTTSGSQPGYFAFGTAVHKALEQYHSGVDVEHNIESFQGCAIEALMEGYHAQWGQKIADKVEYDINCHIGPVEMLMRVDALISVGGERLVLEHKTSSQVGESFWTKKETDAQPCLYILGTRQTDEPADGCVMNVIHSPAKPKDGETPREYGDRIALDVKKRPEYYYQRRTFYKTDRELESTTENVRLIDRAIQHAFDTCEWPQNVSVCSDYGRRCDYAPVCHEGVLISESRLYRKKEKRS